MKKLKKLLILIMLGAAFVWFCHTLSVLWEYVTLWGNLKIGFNILLSQTIFFIGKNVPTIISILIGKAKWD
jgi:hypothetical protein